MSLIKLAFSFLINLDMYPENIKHNFKQTLTLDLLI